MKVVQPRKHIHPLPSLVLRNPIILTGRRSPITRSEGAVDRQFIAKGILGEVELFVAGVVEDGQDIADWVVGVGEIVGLVGGCRVVGWVIFVDPFVEEGGELAGAVGGDLDRAPGAGLGEGGAVDLVDTQQVQPVVLVTQARDQRAQIGAGPRVIELVPLRERPIAGEAVLVTDRSHVVGRGRAPLPLHRLSHLIPRIPLVLPFLGDIVRAPIVHLLNHIRQVPVVVVRIIPTLVPTGGGGSSYPLCEVIQTGQQLIDAYP